MAILCQSLNFGLLLPPYEGKLRANHCEGFFLVSIADQKLREIREQVQTHLASVPARLTPERQKALEEKIREQLKAHNAVIVAHYYTSPEIQALAEATGGCVSDSLEMARFGRDHPAETLLVAGVRFMGETAKILNPEKTILMPNLQLEQ